MKLHMRFVILFSVITWKFQVPEISSIQAENPISKLFVKLKKGACQTRNVKKQDVELEIQVKNSKVQVDQGNPKRSSQTRSA